MKLVLTAILIIFSTLLFANESKDVLVQFDKQLDIQLLKRQFFKKDFSNSQRRDILVPALKEFAQKEQKQVIEFLEQSQIEFTSFFLNNSIYIKKADSKLISKIHSFPNIESVEEILPIQIPTQKRKNKNSTLQTSDALKAINANKLWDLGFDGTGRIVMNIDTGVDGNNPYVASSWFGNQPNITPNDAWYDAVAQNSIFPEDLETSTQGTSTMSLMVGKSGTDTIGVAPNAWWIASKHNDGGVIPGIIGPLQAFTWVSLLPPIVLDNLDVINNSHGYAYGGCTSNSVYQTITIIEEIGVSTVWQAGDGGPNNQTVSEYAAGAFTPVNTFSVGTLQPDQESIWILSSKGPSTCPNTPNDLKIKPEVVAQGIDLKVALGSNAGGGTDLVNGSAFSTPLVSGAIALLKQYKPTATPEEVKTALLNTAFDLGVPGDDNTFGMGRIDVLAAIGELSEFTVNGIVTDNTTGNPIPFAKIRVIESEQIFNTSADGSYSAKPIFDTITFEVSAFGYQTETITNIAQLVPNSPIDVPVSMTLNPSATVSGTFSDDLGNSIEGEAIIFGIENQNKIEFAVLPTDGNGNYSINLPEGNFEIKFVPNFPFPEKQVWQFTVVAGQNLTFDYSNAAAAVLIIGADSTDNVDEVYIELAQKAGTEFYFWDLVKKQSSPNLNEMQSLTQPSAVVWYTDNRTTDAISTTDEQTLVDFLNAGGNLFLSGQNIAELENGGNLMNLLEISFDDNFSGGSDFIRGENGTFLSNSGSPLGWLFRTLGVNNQNVQTSKDILTISGNATKLAGYGASGNNGIGATHTVNGTFNTVFFGFDLASVVKNSASLVSATGIFRAILSDFGLTVNLEEISNQTPKTILLSQNYPNPFNPTTSINYELRIKNYENGKLTVFNVLGKKVKEFELTEPKGNVVWNGKNELGKEVSSGVYFYKLEAGKLSQTKKMVFLK
ncbi:MAG: T9SS C-terminal target domain-containing protein [Calditrichaeota bacterium]|nr:MAG: T9SS C-terminal target domain-containing protein [Calditrichota bacterium]